MRGLFIQTFLSKQTAFNYIFCFLLLLLIILMGISIGSQSIPFSTIITVIIAKIFQMPVPVDVDPIFISIIFDIRMPRVMLAVLVGASLAISGAAFQGFLKNPLADPYTLGVSSGAALGAVIVIFFGISIPLLGPFSLPFISIITSFFTLMAVITFAKFISRDISIETIILTGIIASSFLGALISLLISLTGEELRQIISWLMGSVSMRGWDYVYLQIPFFIIGAIILLLNSRELNAMSFGEETAKFLGVNIQVRKIVILIGAALLTGSAVAVSGTIGFVGLVIPHFARILFGANHRHLIPLSALLGGSFLVLADLFSRTVLAPTELPIGVVTALIGGPVFAIILFKARKIQ